MVIWEGHICPENNARAHRPPELTAPRKLTGDRWQGRDGRSYDTFAQAARTFPAGHSQSYTGPDMQRVAIRVITVNGHRCYVALDGQQYASEQGALDASRAWLADGNINPGPVDVHLGEMMAEKDIMRRKLIVRFETMLVIDDDAVLPGQQEELIQTLANAALDTINVTLDMSGYRRDPNRLDASSGRRVNLEGD